MKIFRNIFVLLFILCVLAYLYIEFIDQNPRVDEHGIHWKSVAITKDVSVLVTKRWGGSIVFFNQTTPNRDVLFFLSPDEGRTQTFFDYFGFYYRSVRNIDGKGSNHSTLSASTGWIIMIVGMAAFVRLKRPHKPHKIELCTPTNSSLDAKNKYKLG